MERGDPVACIPVHPSYKPAEDPRFSPAPPRGTWGGGARDARQGGDGSSCLSMALGAPQKRRGARGREGVLKAGGRGGPRPSPVGRSRSPLSSVALYPGKDQGGNPGARFEIGAQGRGSYLQDRGGGGVARDLGWGCADSGGRRSQKKKKKKSSRSSGSGRCAPVGGLSVESRGGVGSAPALALPPQHTHPRRRAPLPPSLLRPVTAPTRR